MKDKITPEYYGGEDNPYEAIKVINAWGLSFELGNVCKYIARAGKKDKSKHIEDLEKAKRYLELEIEKQRNQPSYKSEEHISPVDCKTEVSYPHTKIVAEFAEKWSRIVLAESMLPLDQKTKWYEFLKEIENKYEQTDTRSS